MMGRSIVAMAELLVTSVNNAAMKHKTNTKRNPGRLLNTDNLPAIKSDRPET